MIWAVIRVPVFAPKISLRVDVVHTRIIGKASLYLRWSSKEALLTDALSLRMARVTDVDTGTLRGDLIELAVQMLDLYAGPASRALLLDTLAGGAMMHALTTPPDYRASLTRDIRAHAEALVSFLLRAVSAD